jgi:hypothetical protein
MSVVPYYNKPMQEGIYGHFRAIADSTALPIILHDIRPAPCANWPIPRWRGSPNPRSSSGSRMDPGMSPVRSALARCCRPAFDA